MQEWLEIQRPESRDAVLSILRSSHGGRSYDSRFHHRQHGGGEYASLLRQRFTLAAKRFGYRVDEPEELNLTSFRRPIAARQFDLL